MSTRRYYNSMAALFVMVFLFIIAGVGIANAGVVHDTIIPATVHAKMSAGKDIRLDVVTKSGNIYSFFEHPVVASTIRIGSPVKIVFLQQEIEGFKFYEPRLDW